MGDPIKYPSAFWIDFISSSLEVNSQLILSTSTEVLLIPLANASPIEAVFPYALAYISAILGLFVVRLSPHLM